VLRNGFSSPNVDGDVPWVHPLLYFPHPRMLSSAAEKTRGLYPEIPYLSKQPVKS
jgi:hypothetical protein